MKKNAFEELIIGIKKVLTPTWIKIGLSVALYLTIFLLSNLLIYLSFFLGWGGIPSLVEFINLLAFITCLIMFIVFILRPFKVVTGFIYSYVFNQDLRNSSPHNLLENLILLPMTSFLDFLLYYIIVSIILYKVKKNKASKG